MEQMVLATEKFLNSTDFKRRFPEAGEDVKVMGYRRDREAVLTVALAFVDRFVPDGRTYFARKAEIEAALHRYLVGRQQQIDRITIVLNALDDPDRGEAGMYLTVLGTSAEGADGGQVGRGNKVNGLIALKRPGGAEAAAGKNPTSHVGKIYSLLSHRLANEIYDRVPGIVEVYIWLCSQIGKPIDQPLVASIQLMLQKDGVLADAAPAVEAIIAEKLAAVNDFSLQLARGEMPVC
jgi:S-adenosylmethionine synthetase